MLNQKKLVKIAVIGKSGHAARLIRLLQLRPDVQIQSVYYPKKIHDTVLPLTTNFDDVLRSNAVIIASPTPNHAEYLDLLESYSGYVLLEKPAVSTEEQTLILKRWPSEKKSRIKVNYNLRHSRLADILSKVISMPEMGPLISFDVRTGHGLAFQEKYKNSWRSDRNKSFGVMELVGTHYINLAIILFGEISQSHSDCYWKASDKDKTPDTVFIRIKLKSGICVNLSHSYATPYYTQMMLTGTNGYWEYDGRETKLYYPKDTFDTEGRFTSPPLVKKTEFNFAEMWKESLACSLYDFLNTVQAGGKFDPSDFDIALASMDPIFQARDNL